MRSADDERSRAERVGDPHPDPISADARVNDLAQCLVVVLRSDSWQWSDITNCPGLDARPSIAVRRRRIIRNAGDEPDHYCGGEDA